MHVSLPPQQEEWIQSLIESGHYVDTGEVVRDAIRLLQHQAESRSAKLLALREAVQKGCDEIDRGEFSGLTVDGIIAAQRSGG